ncbi:VKOR family protein [Actinomyces bovis]|uniref:VKOR family protein n=1 Tax=Actinomyces bovis TaxID=1658 RepID=A0ABY1VM29_9ACTO|nr:vitamin K epoxide reductase family protein [Actinomyces bovis]SPT52542.1 VKOR family protein [Actinomyces bovis]VEG54298.1 VKOR family protein [Actinomyces israelii]
MAHVPSEAEIEAMSEEELQAYLASAHDLQTEPAVPEYGTNDVDAPTSGALARGGAPRSYAILLIVCGLTGLAASWELMLAQLTQLQTPAADLSCDINPLVSCGASLNVWQGNLLGVPNSFLGAMAFTAIIMIGALLACGVRLPRWVWWALSAGCVGAAAFVAWFLGVSVITFSKLCPYCMVIWASVIPIVWHTWARAAVGGHLPLGRQSAAALLRLRWWLVGASYALILGIIVVAFWDLWRIVLR